MIPILIGSDVTIKNSSLKTLKDRVIENQETFPWVNVLRVEASRFPHQVLKELKLHIINDPRDVQLTGELVDDMKDGDEVDFLNRLVLIAPAVEEGSHVEALMQGMLFRYTFEGGKLKRAVAKEIVWGKPFEQEGFAESYLDI